MQNSVKNAKLYIMLRELPENYFNGVVFVLYCFAY